MADLVNTYSEDGRIKETKEKVQIDKQNDILKCVYIFVKNSRNEIFLSIIPERAGMYVGKYGVSSAGIVRSTEDIQKAAHRTLGKEFGIRPKLNILGTSFYNFDGVKRFVTTFYCIADKVDPNKDDVAGGEFVQKEKIEEMLSNQESFAPTFLVLWDKYKYEL